MADWKWWAGIPAALTIALASLLVVPLALVADAGPVAARWCDVLLLRQFKARAALRVWRGQRRIGRG